MTDPKIIQQALQSDAFILKTQQQIIKDFGTVGIDFPEDFGTTPVHVGQLIAEISIRLKALESSNSAAFSQLLYQIDVPETILPQLNQSEDVSAHLAEIILKREAYKVYLRSKFS